MKKLILIIGLSLVSLASINAQNQPPQTVTACEWNKWVTVYGGDGVEICSIIINGFVLVKVEHNNKEERVHIDNIEII